MLLSLAAALALAACLALPGCRGRQPGEPPAAPGGAEPAGPGEDAVPASGGGAPVVSIRVVFDVGAVDDPPGKEGLAALTAALVAGGGSRDAAFFALQERLYPIGGTIRGWADQETTTFVAEAPAEHAPELYAVLRSVLVTPRFDAADFARLRAAQVAALAETLRGADDEQLARRTLELLIFEQHRYAHLPEGTVRSLRALVPDDARAFWRERYRAGNARFGVAGAYPPDLPEALRTDLATLPPGAPEREPVLPSAPAGMPRVVIVEKPTPAATIALGFPVAVNRAHPDYAALLVAMSWLGEHRTPYGRLYRELREARGLNYGDYAYAEHFVEDPGTRFAAPGHPRSQQYASFWIRPVAPANAAFAMRTALAELDRAIAEGIPREEFERQRDFLREYLKLWRQTPDRHLGWALDDDFYGTPDGLARLDAQLAALTAETLQAALVRHLRADRWKAVVVTQDAELLRQQLTDGLPTPVAPAAGEGPGTGEIPEADRRYAAWPLGLGQASVFVVPAQALFETAAPPWRARP
ncbi:MAG: insulinase family protein [Acidobacteria bacterium]|nr:insulinase family protein [Acidobacteriota bacterium]